MVKKLNWKDDRGILVERAEPSLPCDCNLVCLDCSSDLTSGVERGIQVLSSALWKQGYLKLKKWSQITSETRECFPTVSTLWSAVQNSMGTRESVDFTGYSSLRIMGTSTGT